jgi:hypothetical protein
MNKCVAVTVTWSCHFFSFYPHAAPTKAANTRGAACEHAETTQSCHRTVGHVSNSSLCGIPSYLFFVAALTAAAAKQSKPAQTLIPRPKGQAGKGTGYNLQKEMRLGQNKSRYNRLMVRGTIGFTKLNTYPC